MHAQRRVLAIAGVAAVYLAAAKFGLTMAFRAEQVTLVWPPTGLALAALLLLGGDVWPGVVIGAFAANVTSHEPLLVALAIAGGNTLEAVVAAALVRRVAGDASAVNWLRHMLGVIVFGAVVSTCVSATIGVTSLCAGGVQPWSAFGALWRTWWLGDAAGDLLVAPALLTWNAHRRPTTRADAAETAALVLGLSAVAGGVFTRAPGLTPYPLEFTIFPFVIWAALRFGIVGVARTNLLTAGVAIWGTVHGLGPFSAGQGDDRLMLLQIFLGVVTASGLLLGATVSERDASRARKAGMLDAALDCVISIDSQGRVLEFNPAAERTFGYARASVLGRPIAELIVP